MQNQMMAAGFAPWLIMAVNDIPAMIHIKKEPASSWLFCLHQHC